MSDLGAEQPHRHDVLELGLCTAGAGRFLVEDKVFRFTVGTVVVVTNREFHRAHADPGTVAEWSFIFCDPARLVPLPEPATLAIGPLSGPGFSNAIDDPLITNTMRDLVQECSALSRPHARAATRGLLLVLLACLQRRSPTPSTTAAGDADLDGLAPALRLIAERCTGPLAIPTLARACGLSPAAFRRRFAAGLGQTPKDYLTTYRLHRAALQLRTPGTTVMAAALAAGFASMSAFHRQWQAAFGTPPRAWQAG